MERQLESMKDIITYCRKLLRDGRIGFDSKGNPFVILITETNNAQKICQEIFHETGIQGTIVERNNEQSGIQFFTLKAKCLIAWLYQEHDWTEMVRKVLDWKPKKVFPGTVSKKMMEMFPSIVSDTDPGAIRPKGQSACIAIPYVIDTDLGNIEWLSPSDIDVEEEVCVRLGLAAAWKNLKARDRRIVRWLLYGESPNQIAKKLGENYAYTRAIISNVRKRFQQLLEEQGVYI